MAGQLRGHLEDIPATQFFHLIDLTKKTGTYHLYQRVPDKRNARAAGRNKSAVSALPSGIELARITFHRGMFVYATTASRESHLGRLLQKVGKLTPEQYRTLQASATTYSDKALAMALINANFAKQRDIVQTLRFHMLDIVYDTLALEEGSFIFEEDELPPDGAITVRININNIIADSARRRLELADLMQVVPDLNVVLKLCPPPRNTSTKVQLKPEEWHVVSSINARKSIAEIAREWGMGDTEIRRIVAALLRAGLVEPTGMTRPLPSTKPVEDPQAGKQSAKAGTAQRTGPLISKGRLIGFPRKPMA